MRYMQATLTHVDRDTIDRVWSVICAYVRETPVVHVRPSELGIPAAALAIKLEHLQVSGSFKARGAFANLLFRRVPAPGVVAASGGNHGAAVAYAARARAVPATIFVPRISSPAKVARIHGYGARLEVVGDNYHEALAASAEWERRSGAIPIHAFDQIETIAGQGTLAHELSQQAPVDTVLVAVGGGGLISGIASYYDRETRVIGVEPVLAPTLSMALAAGEPVDAPAGGIAADALAPRRVGTLVFPIARRLVDRVVLVSDAALRHAQRLLWEHLRVVVEPGAAAPLAALLESAYQPEPDERLAIVLSGGNTSDLSFLEPIVASRSHQMNGAVATPAWRALKVETDESTAGPHLTPGGPGVL
jgi:threonine dehydratase